MAMGSKAYESPLVSHARMRAMYRALVEISVLTQSKRKRGGAAAAVPLPSACWVGTAIDLREGDLLSDSGRPLEAALLEHIRATGRREAGAAIRRSELKHVQRQLAGPAGDAFPGSVAERITCAVGAALALKAAASAGVVLAYADQGELTPAGWRRLFPLLAQPGLPLIVVTTPGQGSAPDLETLAHRVASSASLAVPVIPVDAGDVVALYRVAQETIVRARTGGGAAVIQCVACGTDAVALLGSQLVRKGICTERWVAGVEVHLRGLLHQS